MSPGAQRPTERSTRSRPRAPLASYYAPMKPSPVRRFIAAGFGAGLIPRQLWGSDNGAGTVGAVFAAVIAILIAPFPEYVHFAAIGIAVILSVWAPTPFLGTDTDPQWVAIDEVAGALIALTGLAGLPWLVGWVVFRIADIWKVLPRNDSQGPSVSPPTTSSPGSTGSPPVRSWRSSSDLAGLGRVASAADPQSGLMYRAAAIPARSRMAATSSSPRVPSRLMPIIAPPSGWRPTAMVAMLRPAPPR